MHLETMEDLFIQQLRDLYNAEKQLIRAMPKMAKAASSADLKETLERHLEETRHQVERLEEIFNELGTKVRGEKCAAMEGLIEEANDMIKADGSDSVRDAGLIAAAQRVEHYEIAGYGTVRTFAHHLGYEHAAQLLQETLDEEGRADKILTDVAEQNVNLDAEEEMEGDAEDEEE